MKLRVINPNTTASMTALIGEAARAVARPGTLIEAVQPSFGAPSIEGHHDDVWAAAGVAEQVRLGEPAAPTRYVIACFGDPGLHAARELARGPVIGIAEAAFHAASLLATGFSVVTTLTRTCVIAEHLVVQYGFERRCRGIHGTDIAVLELEDPASNAFARILAAPSRRWCNDRSGAIVLGCAGMADLCHTLQQRLGVPVVDGVAAAVKLAEGLVGLGLGTSKRGDYASPLAKTYAGLAAPYSPDLALVPLQPAGLARRRDPLLANFATRSRRDPLRTFCWPRRKDPKKRA